MHDLSGAALVVQDSEFRERKSSSPISNSCKGTVTLAVLATF
jgi:hypothetical protein